MIRTGSPSQVIVQTPGIQGGEPIIRGTRVPVRSMALARDDDGLAADSIAETFLLDLADVQAALAYYDTHKAEIDRNERAVNEV